MFHSNGARKKKSLTDPVQIIPYIGQSLRTENPKPINKPSVATERKSFVQKVEAKVLTVPTGKLNSSNVSINQLLEQQQLKQPKTNEQLPKEPFHKDDVVRLWKVQAHEQRNNGFDPIYHVMMKRDPIQLDEVSFLFEVDNAIQLTRLESAMHDILPFLRKEVKNFELSIQLEITKEETIEVKYLNGNDIFEKMARKNSNLFDLKTRFNLDIEY